MAYEGNGIAGRTVEHNLGVEPEMMWVKNRDSNQNWAIYYGDAINALRFTSEKSLELFSAYFNSTPNTDNFILGNNLVTNAVSNTYISYLFASVPDVSKVGSYTGNGTTQTINAEFTQGSSYVLIKRTDSTGDWYLWDSVRGIVSGNDPHLSLNTTAPEVTGNDSLDPDNSGFIVNQNSTTNINVNGGEYIYFAIANDNGKVR